MKQSKNRFFLFLFYFKGLAQENRLLLKKWFAGIVEEKRQKQITNYI